jgi:FeS assembly SUF system regulator
MRLSNMADYAVVTMSAAARHCGSAALVAADGKKRARTSATELAEETGIALPTTQKLVSILSKAGLLRSSRGMGGGIQLARPAAAINLADIIEAVEGPIAMTACVDTGKHNCGMEGRCTVRPHWGIVNDAVRGALAGVPLTQLTGAHV